MPAAEHDIRVAGTAVVLRDGASSLEVLLLRRPATGSFADAWVFPGGRVDPTDEAGAADEADAARRAAARETREEAGIRVHALTPLSRWVPPTQTPVRFRTWFFLAREQGDEVRANPGEIEEARWFEIRRAFAAHTTGGFTLFPPTWITLHGLLAHRTVDDALAAAGTFALFDTSMREGGRQAVWAGDEQHPGDPGIPGARHRLSMHTLPWRYERT